jgi:hypothetical protein
MERYRGILICTINRMTDLDQASIRRFNHKIRFDYLTPEGKRIFYERFLQGMIPHPLPPSWGFWPRDSFRAALKSLMRGFPKRRN